ncbi:17193_t:CDS:2, partial [Racocetra fulgida]
SLDDDTKTILWNEQIWVRVKHNSDDVNNIRTFQGCNHFPRSDSIFYVVDTAGIEAQQIISNIIRGLQRSYLQRNVPSLGRVYSVFAERKNTFK